MKRTGTTISQASAANSQTFVIQPAEVIRTLHKIYRRKSAGLDGASSETVLQSLGEVFTNIFNLSLLKCTVPSCLKTSTIVPVPKQAAITSLNEQTYWTDTCNHEMLERLVLHYIKAATHLGPSPVFIQGQQVNK